VASIEVLRPALRDVLRDLQLKADEARLDQLLAYLTLLQRWNAHYNLTAVREPTAMLTQHLADCLAVIEPLRRQFGRRPLRVLDVGSGGGLPGVVIALLMPEADVTCVDAVGKKAAFVQQVAGELALQNLHARHSRAEQIVSQTFDAITCRAFASLRDFTTLTRPLLADRGVWVAMKAKEPVAEIAQVGAEVEVFHVEQLTVPGLGAERCLVWMRPTT
jgi:16S rRNA (guanine527-N7)-methyltransferase